MAVVETKGLTKKFGKFTALNGVDLTVQEGEVFGFIGPNGAGKTTTIRTLLGIIQATSGSARVFGMDAWKDAVEIHKRIAYVPGDVNLWSNLTGGEVIDLFIKLKGHNEYTKREALIQMFDLDPTKKCRTYSKGNRQKVALIAALASDADLYILDEPTSGLDPLMERLFQQCIMELKEQKKSVLLSSHILSEVEQLCDRVGIIRQGQIIETGTLGELRHLTRINMDIEAKMELTGLEDLSGVSIVYHTGNQAVLKVDSDQVGSVLTHLTKFQITKLNSTPPNLEDLFMSHYSGTPEGYHDGHAAPKSGNGVN